VAECLQLWKAAHEAAKAARRNRQLALSTDKLLEARQALADGATLDPDFTDPAWLTLPVTLADLQQFYDLQLDPQKPIAPRFTTIHPATEQAALARLKQASDQAKAQHLHKNMGVIP